MYKINGKLNALYSIIYSCVQHRMCLKGQDWYSFICVALASKKIKKTIGTEVVIMKKTV